MKNVLLRFVFLFFWFISLLFMYISCSPVDLYQPSENIFTLTSSLQHKDRNVVFKDTITPPNNPMYEVPYIPDAYTFRGVLELEYFKGELYCVIRTLHNDYFLIDDGIKYLMRLDHPQLKNFAVGDTISVSAIPMKLINDYSEEYSLATYFVFSELSPDNK